MKLVENTKYCNNKNMVNNGIVFNFPQFIVILIVRVGSAEGIISIYNL